MVRENLEDCGIVILSSLFTVNTYRYRGVMRSSVNCHCLVGVDLELICAVQAPEPSAPRAGCAVAPRLPAATALHGNALAPLSHGFVNYQFGLDPSHTNGRQGGLGAFVSRLQPSSINRLFLRITSDHAKTVWDSAL